MLRRPDVRITNTTGAGAARPPRHHLLTQEYRDWFRQRGVEIDRYTVELTEGEHTALHTMGWNDYIRRFVEREADLGRRYSPREILEFGIWLRRRFGLRHHKVAPYGG
jgi:hypothetical protein